MVALGRVPEREWCDHPELSEFGNLYGEDARFDWREMPDNFESVSWNLQSFDTDDFIAAGLVEPEGYSEAVHSVLHGEIWNAKLTLDIFESLPDHQEGESENAELTMDYQKAKKIVENACQVEKLYKETNSLFDVCLERAWAEIFIKIQSEDLIVEGVDFARWERLFDDEMYEEAGEFLRVPPQAFRISHDFRKNSTFLGSTEYVATRVRPLDLIPLVQNAFARGTEVSARSFGGILMLQSAPQGNNYSRKRRRGAPHATNWNILKEYLATLNATGKLPAMKDSCIQEVIIYSEKHLGRKVGRTSVQRNLKAQLDSFYAR